LSTLPVRWSATALLLGTLTVSLAACAVYGGGYGYGGAPGLDYYEPYGAAFGGWGTSYHVAPYRGGYQAAGRRPMPSLPSGAGHAGGARGGGGGGGHGGGGGSHGGGGSRR
jgi:hypothetical protein